jgi:hypothetical protein
MQRKRLDQSTTKKETPLRTKRASATGGAARRKNANRSMPANPLTFDLGRRRGGEIRDDLTGVAWFFHAQRTQAIDATVGHGRIIRSQVDLAINRFAVAPHAQRGKLGLLRCIGLNVEPRVVGVRHGGCSSRESDRFAPADGGPEEPPFSPALSLPASGCFLPYRPGFRVRFLFGIEKCCKRP